MFGKWYESLGFKKDFVYLCLDRRQLSIQYNSKEIYKLPDRIIKDIKKIEKENEEVVVEILEAENLREKLKEIKESLNQNRTKENKDLRKEKIREKLIKISKIINSNVFSDEKLLRLENILLRLEEEIL
jgi:hypothetical protein